MNPVVHFEFPYENPNRIARLYESAFGWKIQFPGEEMGDYMLVTTAETDAKPGTPAGAINGGLFPKKPDRPTRYPSLINSVKDICDALKKVVEAGDDVLGEPMEIPGFGGYVSFLDTEGNRNSILQPAGGM